MSEKQRIWQANLYVGVNEDEPIILYGESIADLRNHVAQWIISNQPERFGNASPDYEITKRYNYSKASKDNPIVMPVYSSESREFTSGWIGVDGSEKDWSIYDWFETSENVAHHFVNSHMRILKGPDWKKIALSEGVFPLYAIGTVKKVKEEIEVNDHLQRGWYLISLEYDGESSYDGKLVKRNTTYVIGHPEENADHIPSKADESFQRVVW